MKKRNKGAEGLGSLIDLWNFSLSRGASNIFALDATHVYLEVGRVALEKLAEDGVELVRDDPVETMNAVYGFFVEHGYFRAASARRVGDGKDEGLVELHELESVSFESNCWAFYSGECFSPACLCYNIIRYSLLERFKLEIELLDSKIDREKKEELISARLKKASAATIRSMALMEEMQEEEERLRQIIEQMPVPVEVCSPDGTATFVNDAFLEMFSLSSTDDVVGRYNVFNDAIFMGEPGLADMVKKAYGGETVFIPRLRFPAERLEVSQRSGPAGDAVLDVTIFPVFRKDRSLWQVVTTFKDVTEEVDAEEALRESEALYRGLVTTAQDLIWRCDAEGRFTYLNPAWEKTLGYRLEEMIGRPFSDFQRPEVAERDRVEFQRHLEGGSTTGYETTHLSKSGEDIHLLFNAVPLRDAEGKIVGTQGTAADITERKKATDELVRSEERYRELFNSVKDVIYSVGSDGKIASINTAVKRFGYEPEDLVGREFTEFVADGWREKAVDDFHMMLDKSMRMGETVIRGKDGEEYHVEFSGVPAHSESFTGVRGILRDITERKRLEGELIRRLDEVERLNRLMVGRELRMEELRKEIRELRAKVEKVGEAV